MPASSVTPRRYCAPPPAAWAATSPGRLCCANSTASIRATRTEKGHHDPDRKLLCRRAGRIPRRLRPAARNRCLHEARGASFYECSDTLREVGVSRIVREQPDLVVEVL